VHRLKTDRATGIKIAAKYLRLDDPELLKTTYESSIDENKLPMKRYPTVESYHRPAGCDESKSQDGEAAGIYRPRFVEEFDNSGSGYIDSLYGRKK